MNFDSRDQEYAFAPLSLPSLPLLSPALPSLSFPHSRLKRIRFPFIIKRSFDILIITAWMHCWFYAATFWRFRQFFASIQKNTNLLSDIRNSRMKSLVVKILNKKAPRQRQDRSELLKKAFISQCCPILKTSRHCSGLHLLFKLVSKWCWEEHWWQRWASHDICPRSTKNFLASSQLFLPLWLGILTVVCF